MTEIVIGLGISIVLIVIVHLIGAELAYRKRVRYMKEQGFWKHLYPDD